MECIVVDLIQNDIGLVKGPTPANQQNRLENLEAIDDASNDHEKCHMANRGHGDITEFSEGTCSIHCRRIINILRNTLKRSEIKHHGSAEAAPYAERDNQ